MRAKLTIPSLPIGFLLLLGLTTSKAQTPIDFGQLNAKLLTIVTNKQADDQALIEAISRLGRVTEPADLWKKLADDPTYSLQHRRRAVFALFRRHCADRWTCSELSNVTAPARWAAESKIQKITHLAGWIPIQILPGESVFQISVLNGPAVYVRVLGEVDTTVFSAYLRGNLAAPLTSNPTIVQYAFEDDYDAWLLNRSDDPQRSTKKRKRE